MGTQGNPDMTTCLLFDLNQAYPLAIKPEMLLTTTPLALNPYFIVFNRQRFKITALSAQGFERPGQYADLQSRERQRQPIAQGGKYSGNQ